MENKLDKIDRYFKQRFEVFEQKPPDAVWEKISAKLGHQRRKGAVILFVRIAAGMALLFSLGIGYYFISRPGNNAESEKLADNPNVPPARDSLVHRARPLENHTKNSAGKKSEKSDRLVPLRKVYKGPEVLQEEPAQSEQGNKTSESINRFDPAQFHPLPPLTEITFPANPVLIANNLPDRLDYAPDPVPENFRAMEFTNPGDLVETEDSRPDRWLLASEFAPLYSYRTIQSDYLEADRMDDLNNSENGLLAFAGGIRVAFSTGRRLSVQSGLYYSRYGQEKNDIETYSYRNSEITNNSSRGTYLAILNSTGEIFSDKPEIAGYDQTSAEINQANGDKTYFSGLNGFNYAEVLPSEENNITITQYFDYLELPLTLKYKIIDRKIDFSVSGGLVTNFLVGNVVNLEQNGEKTVFGKTGDINEINYLGSFGLGLEYPIVSGFSFSIEPRLRYYLNPLDKSEQINVHPYSFGFFAGISYVF